MEWLGLIGELLVCALEGVVWVSLEGGAGSADAARGDRPRHSDEVPPMDAKAIARYVSRCSTHDVRGNGSFLSSPESPDPLWDRELDG
jgi:hypothetical protein